jgi:NADPH:quinone reductase-like Zn-dependent oxidoreductase
MRAVPISEFGGPDQLRLGQAADVLIGDDGDRTRALAALLDQQALRPVVSHVLPLAAAAEAHRIRERRHASGKIILDVTH